MTAFHIRPYEHYCTEEILPLYEAVGWTNYTQRPDMLRDAFAGFRDVLAAYDGTQLVGILRAVGDGASILYMQDILVQPRWQRRGVGSALMQALLARWPQIYQTMLCTDDTPKTVSFYESLGFTELPGRPGIHADTSGVVPSPPAKPNLWLIAIFVSPLYNECTVDLLY